MNRRAGFVLIVNQPFERSQTFVDYFTLASLIVFRVLSNCFAIRRIVHRSDLFLESKHRVPSRLFSVERSSMFVKYGQTAFCMAKLYLTCIDALREEASWLKIKRFWDRKQIADVCTNPRFYVYVIRNCFNFHFLWTVYAINLNKCNINFCTFIFSVNG